MIAVTMESTVEVRRRRLLFPLGDEMLDRRERSYPRPMGLTGALLVVLAAACVRPSGGASRYENEFFALALPSGWKLSRVAEPHPPNPNGGGDMLELSLFGAEFTGPDGAYFLVMLEPPPTEVPADAVWTIEQADAGDAVRIAKESPVCTQLERDECLKLDPTLPCCTAGDGTLDVGAPGPRIGRARWSYFRFGNSKRENGVDLAQFRQLFSGFRLKP